jgi:hypothetical protein
MRAATPLRCVELHSGATGEPGLRELRAERGRGAERASPAPETPANPYSGSPVPWHDTFGFQSLNVPAGFERHSQTWIW